MPVLKRKNLPIAILMAIAGIAFITAMLALTYVVCRTYIIRPDPIPVHAIYKRANWNWREGEVDLVAYGDEVTFKADNVHYTMPSNDFIAWRVYTPKSTKQDRTKSFEITLPDGRVIKDECYEPVIPKNQENCVIIDTGVIRYYISPDRVRFG